MPYKRINDLTGLYFHDSCLLQAWRSFHTISLTFSSAVGIGHSCPELKNWVPCPQNPGEDRYAAPKLTLTLEGVTDLSVLKGGIWKDGGWENPPRNLEESEIQEFFPAVESGGAGNHVYDLTWEDNKLTLGVWVDALANYYELTCVPKTVTAAWDGYGEVAWYVEGYRKKYPLRFTFGAIDQESLRWYTMLRDLLPALEPVFLSHNWLVTDCCCNKDNPIWDAEDRDGYCWLTGRELVEFAKNDNTQFIGAVFSGFAPDITREQVLEHPLPLWEHAGYWHIPLRLQHPLANVEMTPWDSACLLFLSHDERLVRQFRAAFPKSIDLVDEIRSHEEGKK